MNRSILLICTVFCFANASVLADMRTYNFYRITGNNSTNVASLLKLDVISVDGSPNQVDFKFRWEGAANGSITEIYFDDGTLLGISDIFNSSGASLYKDGEIPSGNGRVDPGNLPGGNDIGFQVTPDGYGPDDVNKSWGMSLEQDGNTANGIDQLGEYAIVRFDLINSFTYADVISAMGLGLAPGGLAVGIHVRSIDGTSGDSGSDSFVTVPVPGAAFLGVLGLGIAGWVKRRVA